MAKVDRETPSQRATQEILHVISQSRHDEVPVFDVILKNAQSLCSAPLAFLSLVNEARTQVLIPAQRGARAEFAEVLKGFVEPIERTELLAVRPVVEPEVIMMDDIADHELYHQRDSRRVQMVEVEGVRSVLVVPLIKDKQGIGAITLYRREVSPFSEGDVALVENFAAQAVIAIENVRQFREVQSRLERETATAEILSIISRSSDSEKPVFDAILKNAARLCDAPLGLLSTVNEERTHYGTVAHIGARSNFLETDAAKNSPMDGNLAVARAIENRSIVHIEDLKDDNLYREKDPIRVQTVDEEGARTLLVVPLVLRDIGIGALVLYRRNVSLFSDDQIKLVESFASQAVIAIENVRHFRDLQARLERETATKNILEVIGRSREDYDPVFLAILKNSARLCAANRAALLLVNQGRTHVEVKSFVGQKLPADIRKEGWPIDGPHLPCQAVKAGKAVQIADARDGELYRQGDETQRTLVDEVGLRSALVVPLIQDNLAIGAISLHRLHEPNPFSEDDVLLVETFAKQAVIAIENVRQFREVRERLEREKATGMILGAISRSRDDDLPVFDIILENSARLCNASNANLTLLNEAGDAVRLVASHGRTILSLVVGESEWKLDETLMVSESLNRGEPIHIPDYAATKSYQDGSNKLRARLVDEDGVHSSLAVPLMSAEGPIGTLMLHRDEPEAFNEAEISLVVSFAAQAVIAIENVKQFKALESLNAELGDRVQQQVGEIERMGKLKRFLPAAVADTVVSQGSEKMLSSHRALLGVLFCDIRGFTAFCETAEPEETIEVLQTYHEEMGKLINEHGAGVDHRMGDGIMVLFNDPIPCDDPAGDAVRLGLAMRSRMVEIARKWKKLGHRLGFGVGVSLGYATVGMVGYEERSDYTASGTAVNLAARLCDRAEDGEILMSPRAYTAVEDVFAAEPTGEIKLKGIREPVEIYRLLSERSKKT
ncbi:MAG: GAF domain-containing protein [Rhizobiaceae bacterium]